MKYRVLYFLIIIYFVLGGIFFATLDKRSGASKEDSSNTSFAIRFNPENVTSAIVKDPNGTMELVKSGETWKMLSPVKASADSIEVDKFLKALSEVPVERTLTNQGPDSRKNYGIDESALQITILTDNKQYKLTVGKDAPTAGSIYVSLPESSDILLVSKSIRGELSKGAFAFLDKRVFLTIPDDVTMLSYRSSKLDWTVELGETGEWRLEIPEDALADDRKVTSLLEQMNELKVMAFLDGATEALKSYGLIDSATRIAVAGGPGDQMETLLIGSKTSDGSLVFTRKSGESGVLALESEFCSEFERLAKNIRDRRLFPFNSVDIDSLKITRDDKLLLSIRQVEKYDWMMDAPGEGELKDDEILDFLETLLATRVDVFMDRNLNLMSYRLDPPDYQLEVEVDGAKQEYAFGVIPPSATDHSKVEALFAHRLNDDTVFLVEPYLVSLANEDYSILLK